MSLLTQELDHLDREELSRAYEELIAEHQRFRKALEEIAQAQGPFNRDRLTHAENTIEAMQKIAKEALDGTLQPEHQ